MLCKLGLHSWDTTEDRRGKFKIRECRRCGKRQKRFKFGMGWVNLKPRKMGQ